MKKYAWESGVHTWVVPEDWNNSDNTFEVIGQGGAATAANTSGAGGAAYAKSANITLVPGTTVYMGVETTGIPGVWVNFSSNNKPANSSQGVFAATGGDSVSSNAIALGGSSTNCIGQVSFSGGDGGLGNFTFTVGGGAGAAAGPGGAGKSGGDADSSGAGDEGGGGGGGAGGGSSTSGTAGTTDGGAGGAGPSGTGAGSAGISSAGGAGSNGGGGGGGDSGFDGGTGGDGTDMGTVTHQSTGGLSVSTVIGSGGGGGGSGGGTGAGALGGKYGGGVAGTQNSTTPYLNVRIPGLISITYTPSGVSSTGNMFMLF